MAEQDWTIETNAEDYFRHQKKQLQVSDRRPVIRRASDLVGPGLAATAVRVNDFNDILATYNGFFSAVVPAPTIDDPSPAARMSAPYDDESFVGWVAGDAELGGVQHMTGLTSEDRYQRVFRRNPYDAETIYWGSWVLLT